MHQRFLFLQIKIMVNNMFLIQALFIFFKILIIIIMLKITKRSFTIVISLYSQSQYAFMIIRAYSNQAGPIFFYSTCNKLKVHFQLLPKILPAGYTCTFMQINLRICNQLYFYLYQPCRFQYHRFSLAVPRYVICSFNINFLQHLTLRSPIQHPTCHEHLY